jgi:uncharacterized protein (TIGR02453 family)
MPKTSTPHRFSPATIEFIRKASRQKKPEWLDRHREEYEAVLVNPMRDLIAHAEKKLKPWAPGYRFPKRNFARIRRNADRAIDYGMYRDWIGVSISPDSGSRYDSLPNLYFEISDEDVLSAGGLYIPSADQTKHIRSWIDQDASALETLLADRKFKKIYAEGLGTERVLKTKPRDYPLEHPKIEWLKLSAWYVWAPFTKKQLFSAEFPDLLVEHWKQVLRLNQILNRYISTWPKKAGLEAHAEIRAPKINWDEDF